MSESARKEVINYALTRLEEIEQGYSQTSERMSQYKKAANKIHNDLTKEKNGKPLLSPSTYHSYLTAVRNAIKDTGRKHHALTSPVIRKGYLSHAVKHLPEYESDLKALANLPAATIGNGKAMLKDKLHSELSGRALEHAIDIVDGLLCDHPLVTYLTKSKAHKEARAKAESKSLTAKSQHMKRYNYPALIGLAEQQLKDADAYTALAWALALLTGRRATEVLYHAEFEKVDSSTVMFSGQLKKRQGTQTEAYPIPVLTNADDVIKGLKRLRKMESVAVFRTGTGSLDGRDVVYSKLSKRELNRAINQRTNGVLNSRAKRLMQDKAEVFKNTRGIYARYCSDVIRPNSQWKDYNEDEFLKAILGHESTDEVKHYRQVALDFDHENAWLKIKEEQAEKPKEEPTEKAKQNWRITSPIKQLRDKLEGLEHETVLVGTRKVRGASVIAFHDEKLRFWVAENPTMGITQSAIEKNKGNTLSSGTGTVDVRVNRGTFQAWLQVVGKDAVAEYNKQAQQRKNKAG